MKGDANEPNLSVQVAQGLSVCFSLFDKVLANWKNLVHNITHVYNEHSIYVAGSGLKVAWLHQQWQLGWMMPGDIRTHNTQESGPHVVDWHWWQRVEKPEAATAAAAVLGWLCGSACDILWVPISAAMKEPDQQRYSKSHVVGIHVCTKWPREFWVRFSHTPWEKERTGSRAPRLRTQTPEQDTEQGLP
jgi:hypothetical protein